MNKRKKFCPRNPVTADHLSPERLVAGVDSALAEIMLQLRERVLPQAQAFCDALAASQKGGKRLRPVLFLLSYAGYGGDEAGNVMRGAAAIELLHTFALIHDDIVDGSEKRRGRLTLGPRLAQDADRRAEDFPEANHLAMLGGDILFAFAMEIFLSLDFPSTLLLEAVRLITAFAVRTGFGATAELACRVREKTLSRSELLRLFEEKTGLYSFVCPLQAGALLAGAPQTEFMVLDLFGRQVGRAFQIRDDLDDLKSLLLGSAPADPREALLFFPVQAARRKLAPRERDLLERLLPAPSPSEDERERIRALLERADAFSVAEKAIARAMTLAGREAAALKMEQGARQALENYCSQLVLANAAGNPRQAGRSARQAAGATNPR